MGYVKDIQIGSNTHLIEPILYAVTAGTASAYTLSISNFDLQTGVVVTAKINANNNASATLKVGDSAAKTIRYNNANIAANKLVKDRFYSFVYDGTYWQLIGEGSLLASDIPSLSTDKLTSGTLDAARGGTGQSTYTVGDILYCGTANSLSKLSIGTAGYFLKATSSGPVWANTTDITTLGTITTGTWQGTSVKVGYGGTGTTTAPTQGGVIYASSTSAYASTAAGTSGQYLKSNGTSAPTWATFSASTVGLGNVTNDAQVKKAGDSMSGNLSIKQAAGTDIGVWAAATGYTNTDGGEAAQLYCSLQVGSGKINHGVYSNGYSTNGTNWTSSGKWMLYRSSDGNVYVNGYALGLRQRTALTKGTNPSSDAYFLNSWAFQTGTGTAVADRLGGLLGAVASDGTVSFGMVAYSYSTGDDASIGNWFAVKIKGTTLSYTISAPTAFRNALGASSGVWPATLGGTGQSTYTIGDILYSGAANSLSKLSGNTTTTRKFLRSVATTSGTAVAPAWDTVTKTDVGLSNVENTKLSTWAGTANITTVGTISSGTWQGTSVKVGYGGTGATSFTANSVIISGSTTTSALTTRAITNNTSATAVTASTNIITANTLYYHTGNSNITTVGTITSGTWQGTAIGASYGGTGQTSLKNSANTLINALDTGSSNLTANDYVITQYVGGGTTTTTYHRRPASAVINATLVKAALGTDSTTASFLRKDGTWTSTLTANITVKHTDGARYIINDGTRDVAFFGQSLDRTKQGIYSYGYNSGSSFSESPKWMIWRDTDGSSNVPSFTNVRAATDLWPAFTFGLDAQSSTYTTSKGIWGRIYYYCPGYKNSDGTTYTSNHFGFRQFSRPDSNAIGPAPLTNFEQFNLPDVTVGRTTDVNYTILTTKGMSAGALYATSSSAFSWGALPITYGGTGATGAQAARTNLGASQYLHISCTSGATNATIATTVKTALESIATNESAAAFINNVVARKITNNKCTDLDYGALITRSNDTVWRILMFTGQYLYSFSISGTLSTSTPPTPASSVIYKLTTTSVSTA